MSQANLTKFRVELFKNFSMEMIYKTPNDETVWAVLAMLKDIKQLEFGDPADRTSDPLSLENQLSDYEEDFQIQRQDAIENGRIIPSFRVFLENDETCIHKHEGKFYNLYDEACGYVICHGTDQSASYIDGTDHIAYKANNENNLERIDTESVFRFSVKHQFNSNLDLACKEYQAEARKPFVTPQGPK